MRSARSFLAVFSLLSLVGVGACDRKPTEVVPETRGKRGENCQARNDCDKGLACLNGVCSKNEFDVGVAVKQCDRIDCTKTADCCGGKPTKAPTKCNTRDRVCTPTLAGCSPSQTCTSDAVCGEGTCRPQPPGTCTLLGGTCTTTADCQDVCDDSGVCTRSGVICTLDTDCDYVSYNDTISCTLPTRTCNCANPDYVAGAAICSDPDCVDLCLLRCVAERCVADQSCETNADCASFGLSICEDERCVECVESSDCDEDETCENGLCHTPCTRNEECPLFYACNDGDCEYRGCTSDRECILAAANNGAANPSAASEDARLQKCLPSESEPDFKTCKIPCENDGSCGAQSVCDEGYCKFIGCETDEECRAYLGIANQMLTEVKPYVSKAVCREAGE